MSESNTDRQILSLGLYQFRIPQQFGQWPLHVTLLPWFEGADQQTLQHELQGLSRQTDAFHLHVGGFALFGDDLDVPVRLVEPNQELDELHQASLEVVEKAGGQLVRPDYVWPNYQPHITIRGGQNQPHTDYRIDQLALINDIGAGKRAVDSVFALHD